ncbi:hypothetical protein AB3S75_008913 [Citrus x aurantiifolia]
MPSQQGNINNDYLETLVASARPFLRGELEAIDKNLPSLIAVLQSVGAGECWHKHGSFLEHLVDIYRILKIWKAPDCVCLCGLFHSAYSNSYVNLAIFDPNTGRDVVRGHVGDAAEKLIHLFCIVPRQPLIHDDLLFKYSDQELVEHLKASDVSLRNAKEKGLFNAEEAWRKKINELLPADGLTVKHIKTGEDVGVSRRVVATFVMLTIADFSDQLFGFQDFLFNNSDGKLEFAGNSFSALWPGDGKPGLWMNSLSRILDTKEQIEARDLYWEAVCGNSDGSKEKLEKAEELLLGCIEKNPFVGEPHVVLGQIYLAKGKFEEAEREAGKGLMLLLEWGSPWDKRMSWEGWVAWARVLYMKAKEKSWPQTSWGVLNLGFVR